MSNHGKLGNRARALVVDEERARRNDVLKQYCEMGIPSGAFFPKSMTQYRLWEDEALRISRLGSPNSINIRDSSESRGELVKEASRLIVKLCSSIKATPSKRITSAQRHDNDRREIARLMKLTRGMASVIQQLKNELETAVLGRDQMSRDYARLKRELDSSRRAAGKRGDIKLVDVSRPRTK